MYMFLYRVQHPKPNGIQRVIFRDVLKVMINAKPILAERDTKWLGVMAFLYDPLLYGSM